MGLYTRESYTHLSDA